MSGFNLFIGCWILACIIGLVALVVDFIHHDKKKEK